MQNLKIYLQCDIHISDYTHLAGKNVVSTLERYMDIVTTLKQHLLAGQINDRF